MSDRSLTRAEAEIHSTRLSTLLGNERGIQVEFLRELAAFDLVRGYEALGYAKLWAYCEDELRLQPGQVFRRTTAAALIQSFPAAIDYLRDGRLSMTTLVELRTVVSEQNAVELFDAASWKSKQDVAYIVACRTATPAKVTAFGIRKLPARSIPSASGSAFEFTSSTPESPTGTAVATSNTAPSVSVAYAEPAMPRPTVEPVCEDRFSLRLVFDEALKIKLAKARVALSHTIPTGDLRAVIEHGLDLILEIELKKHSTSSKRRKATDPKATDTPAAGRIDLSADLVREVWERDGGCCTWELASGKRCGSTWQLEIDHILPVAMRGESVLGNLRLLCRAHNQLHARQMFGVRHIERAIKKAKG